MKGHIPFVKWVSNGCPDKSSLAVNPKNSLYMPPTNSALFI